MATPVKRLALVSRLATSRPPCRARRRFVASSFFPRCAAFTTTRRKCTQNMPDDGEPLGRFPASGGTGAADDDGSSENDVENKSNRRGRDDAFFDRFTAEDDLPEGMFVEEGGRYGRGRTPSQAFESIDEMYEEEDEDFVLEADERDEAEEPRWPPSFWSMDEEREDPGEDPEFEGDDITSNAHGELEQHRELREFARVMAWDMPLLYNQRLTFEPPTAAQPLRFRYTSYLGEAHPASRKVVLTFSPSALDSTLSSTQNAKLIKLLGVRYNPSTDIAKMSCELYPTAAQNKRYLGDLVDKLLHEVKTGKDDFADVPFDFRYHKPKQKTPFPEEWKMTPERRKALAERRERLRIEEEGASARGELVEGTRIIERVVRPRVESEREAVMQVTAAAEAGGQNAPKKRRATRLRG